MLGFLDSGGNKGAGPPMRQAAIGRLPSWGAAASCGLGSLIGAPNQTCVSFQALGTWSLELARSAWGCTGFDPWLDRVAACRG